MISNNWIDTLAEEAAAIQLGVDILRSSQNERVRHEARRLLHSSVNALHLSHDGHDEALEAECLTSKSTYQPK